jgi:hypothetical protein
VLVICVRLIDRVPITTALINVNRSVPASRRPWEVRNRSDDVCI